MSTTAITPQNTTRGSTAGTIKTVISFISRFGLAAVWLVSGWLKLADPVTTKQSVAAYELFSIETSDMIATVLPPLEIALGIMLLAGIFLRASAAASAVIFAVFIAGIISAWARGLTIDCGCFGGGGYNANVTWWTYFSEILRDLLFIAAAVWTIRWPFKKWALYV